MLQCGDFLACATLKAGEKEKHIRLQDIMPIGKILREGANSTVSYSVDGTEYSSIDGSDANGVTALYLKVQSDAPCRVKFFTGAGFWAKREDAFTETFLRTSGWAGGDGINSFNIANGNDGWNAGMEKTLFIFGDTLISEVDLDTNERQQPVSMPNNTCAIMRGGLKNIEFITPKKTGKFAPLLTPDGVTDPTKAWFWLQDGVVLGSNLYLTPMIILPDETKPEGFAFKVDSVTMVKIPIVNQLPDFENATQAPTKLFCRKNDEMRLGGIAHMPNLPQNGYPDGDGYIYIYGYISPQEASSSCKLIVARTTPEKFEDTDNWNFYDGKGFNGDISKSIPLLEHISCEMSVTPISSGGFKGKYIAVFQYGVQSSYLAYSIGETPWGPFGDICRVYFCDENKRIDESCYMYNSKAHPHLSKEGELLASYNVNSPSMQANYDFADIYRPRFVKLMDTTINKGG